MSYNLYQHQIDAQNIMSKIELENSGGLLCDEMGLGKCLDGDTKVLLWDGGYKLAKNIKVGDILIGDNSTPRNVLSITEGEELMFEIIQNYGEKYIVNKSHILSLKIPGHKKWRWNENLGKYILTFFDRFRNKIINKTFGQSIHISKDQAFSKMKRFMMFIPDENRIDISIDKYLALDKETKKYFKGYKASVDFPEKETDFDPYMVGLLFGSIKGNEVDISGECRVNMSCNFDLEFMSLYSIEYIHPKFIINSRTKRLQLLAGILDANFSKFGKRREIISGNRFLVKNLVYLVGSLGMILDISAIEIYGEYYYRCIVDGDKLSDLPCILSGKLQDNTSKDMLTTSIKVSLKGEGKYYGFMIDGNSRFLLGDFTVTHNTRTMCTFMENNRISKLKTLIICPLSLTNIWIDELNLVNENLGMRNIKILFYHGQKRNANMLEEKWDYVITTYSIISAGEFRSHKWGRIILDEAHTIRNGLRKSAPKCAVEIFNLSKKSVKRWCITGTPFNNRIKDIAALCRFINQEPYNDIRWWKNNEDIEDAISEWNRNLVIRRTKDSLLSPPIYYEISVSPKNPEIEIINNLRNKAIEKIQEWKNATGTDKITFQRKILGLIQKLRIVSNSFYIGEENIIPSNVIASNSKVEKILNDINDNIDQDPKKGIVIFSFSVEFLNILKITIKEYLPHIRVITYNGEMSSSKRISNINSFNLSKDRRVILVSLLAGGVGISLHHGSSTLFLCEPYYNPFVEQQAEERVHRLGQTNTVRIFRYVMEKSIEIWINALKSKKLDKAKFMKLSSIKRSDTSSFNDLLKLFEENVMFVDDNKMRKIRSGDQEDDKKILRNRKIKEKRKNFPMPK